MKKINLLQVVFGIMSGGVERMLLNYFSGEEFKDYNLYIAYFGKPDERCLEEFKKCGFQTIRLHTKTKNRLKCYKEIKSVLKKYKIDIVHSNINIENYLVMKAAYDCNIPIRISHSHGLPEPTNNFLRKEYRKIKIYLGNKYSTCNFACSDKAGKYLFGKNKYRLIYNAMETSIFRFDDKMRKKIREELDIKDSIVIGYVARFNNGKNHDFLIDIFDKMDIKNKNVKVIFIGAGPFKQRLEEKIKMLELQNNIFLLSSKQNIYDYYQAMDLFVFPSSEEGLGMVAIESQINGLYCICSTGVPIDTKISDNIIYLDLIPDLWIREITKNLKLREDNKMAVYDDGKYNIFKQRIVLYNLYKELINEKNGD